MCLHGGMCLCLHDGMYVCVCVRVCACVCVCVHMYYHFLVQRTTFRFLAVLYVVPVIYSKFPI